jgi:hypothetical protein
MGSDSTARFGLEELDLRPAERATLADFLRSWDEHEKPVLFVGAGMTTFNAVPRPGAASGTVIKDWAGLIADLRTQLSGGDATLLKQLEGNDYLRTAQLHETQFRRARLLDAIDAAVPAGQFVPGPAHGWLKRFPWKAIITTNYDDLIERAFEGAPRRLIKVISDDDLTCRRPVDSVLLVKMHGDLAIRDSIVLTEEDYRCYEKRRPGVSIKVKQLLLEHPSLFIGFSLTDPNVAAIEGWIRDTTGQLRLPSVALVHREPLPAEQEMWAGRGVRLVHVRGPQENLERFFEAMQGERTSKRAEPSANQRSRGSVQEEDFRKILEARAVGWEAVAAKIVADVIESGDARTISNITHLVLIGGFSSLAAEDIRGILDALGPGPRRAFLLRAHENGLVKAWAFTKVEAGVEPEPGKSTGPSQRRRNEVVLDVEEMLLSDTISPNERAAILYRRAQRLERQGDLEGARKELVSAREICVDDALRLDIRRRLRTVLLRLGDEAHIQSELLDVPLPEDACSYARRGAELLLTRGREAAVRVYAQARDAARTGDEKTAALMGLAASCDVDDWSRQAELEEQRRAIWPGDKPRAEAFWTAKYEASEELLKAIANGDGGKGEHEIVLSRLQSVLAEADDMGWPAASSPNVTMPSDRVAHEMLGLLLRDEATVDEIKRGLRLAVERGLFNVKRHVTSAIVEKLLSAPDGAAWARTFVAERAEALYMRRTRLLLKTALLPALPDDDISRHVSTVFSLEKLESASLGDTPIARLHYDLLRNNGLLLLVPREGAIHLVGLAARALRSKPVDDSLVEVLRVPLEHWVKIGILSAQDEVVRELIAAVMVALEEDAALDDYRLRRSVLHLINEIVGIDAMSADQQVTIRAAFDRAIERFAARDGEGGTVETLELVRAREPFGEWSPSEQVKRVFMASYERLRNSTAAGTWANAVDLVGRHLGQAERATVVEHVDDYLELALARTDEMLGASPEWAGTAIHQSIKLGILSASGGQTRLERLTSKHPDCAPFALGLNGVDTSRVEAMLLRAISTGAVEFRSFRRWCSWQPVGAPPSPRVERALLGALFSSEPEIRQDAYWSLELLARNKALSAHGRKELEDTILLCGVGDPAWRPRASAILATARIHESMARDRVEEVLRAALADDAAGVRRFAGLLQRALGGASE